MGSGRNGFGSRHWDSAVCRRYLGGRAGGAGVIWVDARLGNLDRLVHSAASAVNVAIATHTTLQQSTDAPSSPSQEIHNNGKSSASKDVHCRDGNDLVHETERLSRLPRARSRSCTSRIPSLESTPNRS